MLHQLCDYGCGLTAIHQFSNGKYCCSRKFQSCVGHIRKKREKIRASALNYYRNENEEKKAERIESHKKHWTKEERKRWSKKFKLLNQRNKRTINKIKDKYPTFYKAEELRYNPNKPDKKEIQVHCKNHNCSNSKEQGGWFTPKSRQIERRIQAIEYGTGGRNFYCSEKCKIECPLYKAKPTFNRNILQNNEFYTQEEYNIFRKAVISIQKEMYGYNFCERCDKILHRNITIHHEKPKKIFPIFSLDPDNGIVLCRKCHSKIHIGECSGFNIAKKCKEEQGKTNG